jgi:acyl-CoA thioester hydrolase
MNEIFQTCFRAGWRAMDANGHMANTAYLDFAADTRFRFFEANGFTARDFERTRIGPVVMRDATDYRAEILLQEEFSVTFELMGLSEDGSRFRLRNTFLKSDGRVAAVVITDAGWWSLDKRRLVAPPPALAAAMALLNRTDDFAELPSSLKK